MIVYEALWKAILTSSYLQVDETSVKVLKPDKQGFLWSYYAPCVGNGLVIFELSLTRSGTVAENRLALFKGLLQTDGYNGYQKLRDRDGIDGLGCLTHARRKFSDVVKITKNQDGIAAEAIERLKPLYELEAAMRERNDSFHTRKRLRQKNCVATSQRLSCLVEKDIAFSATKKPISQCYFLFSQAMAFFN